VSSELTNWYVLSEGGLLDAFIDDATGKLVASAWNAYWDDYDEEKAVAFRKRKLMERYFSKWRVAARKKAIAALGKKSRQRMRQLIQSSSLRRKRSANSSVRSDSIKSSVERTIAVPVETPSKKRSCVQFAEHQEYELPPNKRLRHAASLPAVNESTPVGPSKKDTSLLKSILKSSTNGPTSRTTTPSKRPPFVSGTKPGPDTFTMPNNNPLFASRSVFSPHVLKRARSALGTSTISSDRRGGDTVRSDYWRLKALGLHTLPNGVTQPIRMGSGNHDSDPSYRTSKKRALDDADLAEGSPALKRPAYATLPRPLAASSASRLTNGHHRHYHHSLSLSAHARRSQQLSSPTPAPKGDGEIRRTPTGHIVVDLTSDDDDEEDNDENKRVGAAAQAKDEDEELFAQIRALNAQMEEDTEWMQEMTRGSGTPSEILEGPTPSRLSRSRATRSGWVDE
jgi:hypothetical protein